MTDPRRLVDGTDLGAKLLASARSDSPARDAPRRVAAALGLATVVATTATSSSVTGAARSPGAAEIAKSGAGAARARAGVSSTWFTLVGGALVAAGVAGALILATRRGHTAHASHDEMPRPFVAAPAGTRALEGTTERARAISVPARPMAEQGAQGGDPGRGKVSRAIADLPAETPLARELRVLDTARSALDRRDVGDALEVLDRYDRTFPNGTLRTEASLLRVETLLARGDATEARKLARELLVRDPSGPHARRLRTIADSP